MMINLKLHVFLDRYDHAERLTAREAQAHPYFFPVRQAELLAQASAAGAYSDSASSFAAADFSDV